MNSLPSEVLAEFQAIVGAAGMVGEPSDIRSYLAEARGRYHGETPLVLLPGTTAEVSAILRVCSAHRIGVVPQGGNTGLVGGSVPQSTAARPEILISARRLNIVRQIDPDNFTITAEAGCVLASLQAAAAAADRLFPLSLGAEGSCQLGGNISTNAGGTAVLRYGCMRDLVLGLEVVLPDGRVLDGLRSLRKDNTGYDLKQLFIGAEGTLGFVTAATCKLFPQPRTVVTAWLGVHDVATATQIYSRARSELGDDLTAFEFANQLTMDLVVQHIPGSHSPLTNPSPWHLLIEVSTARSDAHLTTQVEGFLADLHEQVLITDGVVATSGAQREALWHLRHSMPEAQKKAGASIKHDVSVPVTSMARFLGEAGSAASHLIPGVRLVSFGHLGDGNVHFNLSQPEGADPDRFMARREAVSRHVHEIAMGMGGSFSAEHGIGLLKVDDLARWRGGTSRELMQILKQAIDPLGIMNPGKLLAA
ncbi:MAG: FAD-binding oxidoreductase, partial [Gammaproteobacteria bacterium]